MKIATEAGHLEFGWRPRARRRATRQTHCQVGVLGRSNTPPTPPGQSTSRTRRRAGRAGEKPIVCPACRRGYLVQAIRGDLWALARRLACRRPNPVEGLRRPLSRDCGCRVGLPYPGRDPFLVQELRLTWVCLVQAGSRPPSGSHVFAAWVCLVQAGTRSLSRNFG